MKVVYTDSARQAMDAFKDAQAKELEERIKSQKYVYGDDTVEITANDIREAADRARLQYRPKNSYPMTQLVLQAYIGIGVLTFIGGLLYEQLRENLTKNPTQLILIGSGFFLSFMSFVMLQRFRVREEETRRIEQLEEQRERLKRLSTRIEPLSSRLGE